MGSSATGICLPQKSKKRVFPGSSLGMDSIVEVSSPPDNLMMLNRKNTKHKQNEDAIAISSRTVNGLKSHEKGKSIIISSTPDDVIELDSEHDDSDSCNAQDFIDLSSDDSASEDEYAILQSHFDSIDLPAGIEASIPQFSESIKMKNKMPSVSSLKVTAKVSQKSSGSSLQLQRGSMKFQSVKKLIKTRHHKKSSGSVVTGSHSGHDQLDHVANHEQIITLEDGTLDQDFGENNEVLRKYKNFKKFDMVEDYSDHHYSGSSSAMMEPSRHWAKKIQEEWRILEKDLPDMIFVRVYESRMDLLRAVIVGAEGTPYHDGLFFFDVSFPKSYPHEPPHVHYHSGGLRINPNLYDSGKVCLSLLNTWQGAKNEKWTPGVSTMLQVLVSIQGLILNAEPYFNEPGFERYRGNAGGERASLRYNEQILVFSLKTMVYTMKKPPKHFQDLVIGHFHERVRGILMTCKAYHSKGIRVGFGVDEGEETCSKGFKNDVEGYMKTLVGAFIQIGVKDAAEFVPQTKNLITQSQKPILTQKIKACFGI